jgi:hypothetical protein
MRLPVDTAAEIGSRDRAGVSSTWWTGIDHGRTASRRERNGGGTDDVDGAPGRQTADRRPFDVLVDDLAVDNLGRRPRRPGTGRRAVGRKMAPPSASSVASDGVAFPTEVRRRLAP